MIKQILLFFAIIPFVAVLNAQTLEIYTDAGQLVAPEQVIPIEITEMPDSQTSYTHFKMKNTNQGMALNVKVRGEMLEHTDPEKLMFNICVGNACYPAFSETFESDPFTIQTNSFFPETLDADLLVVSENIIGTIRVKITLVDAENENNSTSFIIAYNINIGLSVPTVNKPSFKVWPNPTSNNVYISGATGCNVNVINAIGQVVSSTNVTDNKHFIDLSKQRAGIYFVQVVRNGKTETTRKVIKQ